MSPTADPPTIARPEPAKMTLGDLVALIAGAAMAASLTWYSQQPRVRMLAGRPAPEWYVVLLHAREVLRKGCMALVPVILARKVRHGGPIRPGEFAALCVGADQLMLALYGWPFLGILTPIPGKKDFYEVNDTAFWIWKVATFAASALAAILLATLRRRLPAVVSGLLLVASWYGLYSPLQSFTLDAVPYLMQGFYPRLSTLGRTVLSEAIWFPFVVIGMIPAVFAALDAARRRPGRTWVEWTGLALALGWEVCVRGQTFVRQRLGDLGPRNPEINAVYTVSLILAILVALVLARLLDPPFRRWLGLTTDLPPLVPGSPEAKMESSPPV
jgi:hypothetical protein